MAFQKNQILTLSIESLSNDGSGVAHHDGQPVFVAAAAGAGYGTILFDAAGAGGQQLFQFAEGIAFHGLDDAHFG